MTTQRPLFKIQCRLWTPAALNLTSIQNKMLKSSPLHFLQYSFIPATNSFTFQNLLWSKPRRTCPTLSTGTGNGIPINSLISPSHLHFFPGLISKIKSKRTIHQHLEAQEKDGDYFVSPFAALDADTLHIAFGVMLKTGVNFHVKYHCHW